jgi:hypothetical protein
MSAAYVKAETPRFRYLREYLLRDAQCAPYFLRTVARIFAHSLPTPTHFSWV